MILDLIAVKIFGEGPNYSLLSVAPSFPLRLNILLKATQFSTNLFLLSWTTFRKHMEQTELHSCIF
jgi:hypothetical protein